MASYGVVDPRLQQQEDENHLKWLTWGIYAFSALQMLYFLAIFGFVGLFFTLGMTSGIPKPGRPGAEFPLLFFLGIFGFVFLWNLVFIGLDLYGAYCLKQRKNYILCIVVGALLCMHVPFGTVLGVFLILVLNRPSVKALFNQPVRYPAPSHFHAFTGEIPPGTGPKDSNPPAAADTGGRE